MRNPALPRLLRAIAESFDRANRHDVIFNEAANELEKLDKIEIVLNSIAASKESIADIINDRG